MKKLLISTAAAIFLVGVAVWSFAGIGPTFGLPGVNAVSTDNLYYNVTGNDNVGGAKASVMCVACHSRNPAYFTAQRTNWGLNFIGSHFVTRTFADTSEGGGYETASTGKDITRATRTALPYYMAEMGTALKTPFVAAPKYGYLNGGVIDNTTNPGTVAAQLICESCHNIVKNIGPRKLIADGRANKNAALCVGCHGDMDGGITAEYQYHPLMTGQTWAGTHHHRNSHSVLADTLYDGTATQIGSGTHDMGQVARTYYPDNNVASPVQMWAAGYGTLGATARAITCTTATNPRMGGCADNGQIRMSENDTTPATGGGFLLCTNCHRGHNAVSSAGATILMTGTDNTTNIGNIPNPTGITTANQALWRMTDQGGRASAFNTTNPLCLSCHK